MTVILFFL